MTAIQAFLQGVIQGLTEFLPVSSSGHLSLFQYFTGLSGETGAFFSVVLHFGTLLAVFAAFYRTILELIVEGFCLLGDLITFRFRFRNLNPKRRMILMLLLSLIPLVAVVFLKDFYESFSTDNDIVVEGICLIITGLLLYLADHCVKGRKNASSMTNRDALAIGVAQAVAPLPGISRSGSTISVGLMMGLEREFAVAFSFIMGIPAVLGAIVLEIPTVVEEGFSLPIGIILIGVITSALFGILAIKMVKWLVKGDKFIYFSYYTLGVGLLVTGIGIYEHFSGHALQLWLTGLIG